MPEWLAREVTRAAGPRPTTRPLTPAAPPGPDRRGTAYLATVIDRGAAQLADMRDGRKRALAALAYHAGGLPEWSGLGEHEVADWITGIGAASGLSASTARRIVTRSLANGLAQPLAPPPGPRHAGQAA